MMKYASRLSLLPLTLLITACGQKPEAPVTQTAPAAETVQKATPATSPKAESKAEKAAPVKTESSQNATPAKPQTAQDAIEEVNQYGREKTKTQVSKARDRAQAAEEDMMRDLEKLK